MKKIFLIFSILVLSVAGFSQSELGITFCGIEKSSLAKNDESKITLPFERLSKCKFSPIDHSLNLYEFYAEIEVQGDVKSFTNKGEKLNEIIILELEKLHPRYIYITQIKLSGKEEQKLIGKSFKIHLTY